MADIYTPPPDFAYLLASPFSMPSDRGDRWAVSFTGNSATLVAAALSVTVTVSFLCLWNLVSFIALWSDGGDKASRRRYVAMVTIWNSNDPWFAFKELVHFTFHAVRDSGAIGNVAPVRPSTVFYPDVPVGDAQKLQDFGLRAPGVMRALGSVEAARVTLRTRVSVQPDQTFTPRPDGDRIVHLDYDYSLSGVDFGLQGGTDLNLAVEGACITEYGWTAEPPEEYRDVEDDYLLWNIQEERVDIDPSSVLRAPFAGFHLHPNAGEQLFRDSNVSYAILIHSAHRSSIESSDDPWYATELRPQTDQASPKASTYRMKRNRPVLSCTEKDTWSYRGQTVASVVDLKDIPGITIPKVLLEVLEVTLIGGPMIVRLGNAAGDSALRSRTTSMNGLINAAASSVFDDMERLVLASFAATRAIFTDATMFGQPEHYTSIITGPNGQPKEGAGNFVISSPDIQTFSLTGIVTLAVILLVLLLANTAAWGLVRMHLDLGDGSDATPRTRRWMRYRVLAAIQLFRCLYEEVKVDGKQNPDWNCTHPIPEKHADQVLPLNLSRCNDPLNRKCMGHATPRTQDVPVTEAEGTQKRAALET